MFPDWVFWVVLAAGLRLIVLGIYSAARGALPPPAWLFGKQTNENDAAIRLSGWRSVTIGAWTTLIALMSLARGLEDAIPLALIAPPLVLLLVAIYMTIRTKQRM